MITRLTETWQAEQRAFAARDLPAVGYVYLWADGIHVSIRLAFYDYPAGHGVHLRTTNPIKSIFAAVRHRSKITKGPGSRAAGLAMAVKLIESAQDRWRAASAPHLVALVRAGATFINGKLVERPGEDPSPKPPKDLDPQVLTIARSSGPVVMASTGKSVLPGEVIAGPVPRDPAAGTASSSRFGDVKAGRAVQPVSRLDQTRPRRNTMFGKRYVHDLIERSAENPADRRRFLKSATAAGLGMIGASVAGPAATAASASAHDANSISDSAILNFALNLEYLEGEFYSFAVHGHGLPGNLTHGTGRRGPVIGGRAVPFRTRSIRQFAAEIAHDEFDHVRFLHTALGSAAVARPTINIKQSFTAVAIAAGLIKPGQTFDVYADENNFLQGAFIFEDVGVTAFKGAAPLISNKTFLSAAAGMLAVEAYHAATIRTSLFDRNLARQANAISDARDSLDGPSDDDRGITLNGTANIVPADSNSVAFGRTPGRVLNVVYLTPKAATSGGFYPNGVNGQIHTSS